MRCFLQETVPGNEANVAKAVVTNPTVGPNLTSRLETDKDPTKTTKNLTDLLNNPVKPLLCKECLYTTKWWRDMITHVDRVHLQGLLTWYRTPEN